MKKGIRSEHWNDANGNPAGGSTYGTGFAISWQNGPLGQHSPDCIYPLSYPGPEEPKLKCVPGCTRKEPNGAFVEDVIEAAADRIRYYQDSRFACGHNARALAHLEAALEELHARTANRETRKVEGTHGV